jgi:hypothetical protein
LDRAKGALPLDWLMPAARRSITLARFETSEFRRNFAGSRRL